MQYSDDGSSRPLTYRFFLSVLLCFLPLAAHGQSCANNNNNIFGLSGPNNSTLATTSPQAAGTYTACVTVTMNGVLNPGTSFPVTVTGQTGGGGAFTVNLSDVHQTIDGFGGADAQSGTGTLGGRTQTIDANLHNYVDQLYCLHATDPGCSSEGIGLRILREEVKTALEPIGGTFTAPTAADIADAQAVVARGGKVYGSPWCCTGSTSFTTMASQFLGWAQTFANNGVSIYGISTENEGDLNSWDAPTTVSWIKTFGPQLHSASMKMLAPETAYASNFAPFTAAIEADGTANSLTDIFAGHQYGGVNGCDGTRTCWETEMSDFQATAWNPSIAIAVSEEAQWINDQLVNGNATAWLHWWLVLNCATYPGPDQNSPGLGCDQAVIDSGTGGFRKAYFVMGNWSRYVRPGWVRVGTSGSLAGISGISAFKDPVTGNFAVVVINNSGSALSNVSFSVNGATGSVVPYVTSGTPIGALGSDGNLSAGSSSGSVSASIPVTGGTFASTVPYGVTTFVGSSTGGGGGAVTASLSANPTTISTGQSSTLTWSSTNASSCTSSNFSTGNATSGSIGVTPSSTTTYTVNCGTATASATVTVITGGGTGCQDPDMAATNIPSLLAAGWTCLTGGVSADFDRDTSLPSSWGYSDNYAGTCAGATELPPFFDSQGVHTASQQNGANWTWYGPYIWQAGDWQQGKDFYIEYKRKLTPAGSTWAPASDYWFEWNVGPYGGFSSTDVGMNAPEYGGVNYNYWKGLESSNSGQFPGSTVNMGTFFTSSGNYFDGNWHSVGIMRANGVWNFTMDGISVASATTPTFGPNPPGYNYPFFSGGSMHYQSFGLGTTASAGCPTGVLDSTVAYLHVYRAP